MTERDTVVRAQKCLSALRARREITLTDLSKLCFIYTLQRNWFYFFYLPENCHSHRLWVWRSFKEMIQRQLLLQVEGFFAATWKSVMVCYWQSIVCTCSLLTEKRRRPMSGIKPLILRLCKNTIIRKTKLMCWSFWRETTTAMFVFLLQLSGFISVQTSNHVIDTSRCCNVCQTAKKVSLSLIFVFCLSWNWAKRLNTDVRGVGRGVLL